MQTSEIIKIEKEWKARGYTCGLWMDPPGQKWENFQHETEELFMLIDGDVELEINGAIQRPSKGKEIVIPAKVPHSVRNKGRTPSRWLYGYLKKDRTK